MTANVYTLAYLTHLLFAGLIAWTVGGYRQRNAWFGLFTHWGLVVFFVSGHPMSIPIYIQMHAILAWMFYRYSSTRYGDAIALTFALLLLAAFGAGIGLISVERGLGITAPTFWNIQAVLLHFVLLLLEGSCLDSRVDHRYR